MRRHASQIGPCAPVHVGRTREHRGMPSGGGPSAVEARTRRRTGGLGMRFSSDTAFEYVVASSTPLPRSICYHPS